MIFFKSVLEAGTVESTQHINAKERTMSRSLAMAKCPILFTHWDPDVYPAGSLTLPPVQELLLHILAYGEVRIKDVDLFLNPAIRSYFSDESTREQFASLLETGRLQVLVPPKSTVFDIDPLERPLTAVALERLRNNRPFKDQIWKFTPETKRYCQQLDDIIARAHASVNVIRFRSEFPATENTFAKKFAGILSGRDGNWRKRPQFSGITGETAAKFARLAEDPDFYRSAVYEHSRLYPQHQRRSLRNLAQSVYAYCELSWENAAGTYLGSRISEMPPVDDCPVDTSIIEMVPIPGQLRIPVATNIGEIVCNVLDECSEEMRVFWESGVVSDHPNSAFIEAWNHIADAFARHSVNARSIRTNKRLDRGWQSVAHGLGLALISTDFGGVCGFKLLTDLTADPLIHASMLGISAIASFGDIAVNLIRKGQAYDARDTRREQLRRILLDSATIRGGTIR